MRYIKARKIQNASREASPLTLKDSFMASITTKIVRDPKHKDPRIAHLPGEDNLVVITSEFNRPTSVEDYVDQLGDATCLALLQKGYDLKAHNFHRMFVLKNMQRVSEAGVEPQVWEYVGTPEQLADESASFRPEKRERIAREPRERKAPTPDSIIGNVGKLDEAGKAALVAKLRAAGLI